MGWRNFDRVVVVRKKGGEAIDEPRPNPPLTYMQAFPLCSQHRVARSGKSFLSSGLIVYPTRDRTGFPLEQSSEVPSMERKLYYHQDVRMHRRLSPHGMALKFG
jgi:hypothetical protein